MKHIFKSLYFQVIVGILVGIFFGVYFPDFAVKLKPLGDAFIKLIKMVIAPLIFSSIVIGIAGMQDVKKVGKIGLTSIIYFEVMTTIALIIGLIFVNVIQPGTGMNADPASLDISSVSNYIAESKKPHSFMDFIIDIIPENVIASIASDNMLQVLVFAVLFGIGMTKIGQKASEPVINVLQSFLKVLFPLLRW